MYYDHDRLCSKEDKKRGVLMKTINYFFSILTFIANNNPIAVKLRPEVKIRQHCSSSKNVQHEVNMYPKYPKINIPIEKEKSDNSHRILC
jgi:hypothetical protein